jgi:hypothetical protein
MLYNKNLVHILFMAIILVGGMTLLVLYLQTLMWAPHLLSSVSW